MAYFKIEQPNQPTKWIKSIDRANGTLEFSTERDGCFQQDSGFFADSEFAYLKFHFTEAYPELEYMTIDTQWHRRNHEAMGYVDVVQPIEPINEVAVGGQVFEEVDGMEMDMPNDPWADQVAVPQMADQGADLPQWG